MSSGPPYCPKCGGPSDLLATTNEWKRYCPACDRRFNDAGEMMDEPPPLKFVTPPGRRLLSLPGKRPVAGSQ